MSTEDDMPNIAISYIRFSTTDQLKGDSLRRQTEATDRYCKEHNLILDQSLTFRDLGVSAYDRSNIKTGALGLLLRAAEEKRIPEGATLIVESLDRLSRAQVLDALQTFIALLNTGLKIVTLIDNQEFTRESVGLNFGQLMMSIVIMQRAHDESKTKSVRQNAAWENKKRLAKSDKKLMTRKVPNWISIDQAKTKVELIESRAKVALEMIEMAERGIGTHTIMKHLNRSDAESWGISPKSETSPKWAPSTIQKFFRSHALYGAIELLNGDIIEGYYPPLITKDRWDRLNHLRAERKTTGNVNKKGRTLTNLFSGRLRCGYCGFTFCVAGYKSRVTGYERKYVACQGARFGSSECRMFMWFIDELEPVVLFWLTTIDYSKFTGHTTTTALDQAKIDLAVLSSKLNDTVRKIENTKIAIEEGAKSMVQRLQQHEEAEENLRKQLTVQKRKVLALEMNAGSTASRMSGLVKVFKLLKNETDEIKLRALREQLAHSIQGSVEKIVLYPAGRTREGTKAERFIDVTFKNGIVRRIEPWECNPTASDTPDEA